MTENEENETAPSESTVSINIGSGDGASIQSDGTAAEENAASDTNAPSGVVDEMDENGAPCTIDTGEGESIQEEGNAQDVASNIGTALTFADLGLDEITLLAVQRKGFVIPSPIQILAIPRLLGGDANVIARARTGTGKTAAFGLPLTQRIRERADHVRAIILEPTRELAMQTAAELQSFVQGRYPRVCVVYGGASYSVQIKQLRQGVEIVVGTPGRVQDHLRRGTLDISKIDYFILDEGDEMLDMGFIDDIEGIFKEANPACRVLLFSATMPPAILRVAQKFMGEYEVVEEEGKTDEPLAIEQHYWVVREREKINALVRLIDSASDFYGLVFTQTKNDADYLCRALDERGYNAAALHGDVPQGQREKILASFRARRTSVLVATDVAARGIDITGLSHVVNYSLPFDGATYVHRIGRTGRAGAAGVAITFVRPEERRRLRYIESAISKASKGKWSFADVPSVEDVLAKKRAMLFDSLKEKVSNATDERKTAQYKDMAERLCEGDDALEVLTRLIAAEYGKSLDRAKYGEISRVGNTISTRGGYGGRRLAYADKGQQRGAYAASGHWIEGREERGHRGGWNGKGNRLLGEGRQAEDAKAERGRSGEYKLRGKRVGDAVSRGGGMTAPSEGRHRFSDSSAIDEASSFGNGARDGGRGRMRDGRGRARDDRGGEYGGHGRMRGEYSIARDGGGRAHDGRGRMSEGDGKEAGIFGSNRASKYLRGGYLEDSTSKLSPPWKGRSSAHTADDGGRGGARGEGRRGVLPRASQIEAEHRRPTERNASQGLYRMKDKKRKERF